MQIYSDKLFENPVRIIKAFDNDEFIKAFAELEKLKEIYYLVGYIRYEAYKIFQNIPVTSKEPFLYFEAYRDYSTFKAASLAAHKTYSYPKVSKEEYCANINYIKEQIACGNTYEVNYTFPNEVWTDIQGIDLYKSLINEQKTPYNAYIKNEFEEVLSFSPELFFRLKNGKILTKPMKGTIKRGSDRHEDAKNRNFLRNDIKNRAENLMIVDLLRNDLGQIAKTGSVKVDKLFEIETHKTLHQMTSEISAMLDENVSLYNIFKAIFPCGSITGAPKFSTMNIIEKIENKSRGIYCGAIGYIHRNECEFSVPIRILQRKTTEPFYTCNTGGAIVWDSIAADEWSEALLKRAFLGNSIEYSLIDTIAVKEGKVLFEHEHLTRLNYNIPDSFKSSDCIVRIKKSPNGVISIDQYELTTPAVDKVLLANNQTHSKNPLLYVKTDYRPWYESSMDKIQQGEVFDEIYFNERGELTEGARSNIILKKDGKFYTPSLSCGLLDGIYRQYLLKKRMCKEKVLYRNDLLNADEIYCCNSVRGMVRVKLCL